MLLSLSILGIVLSVILLHFNARKYTSSFFLGAFFFLVSLYGFIEYVVLYSKSVPLVAVFFVNIGFLSYLTGPMLYFYVRRILTDDSRLKKSDLWHLLPMLIFLAGTANYILTPWSFKLDVASKLVEDPNNIGNINYIALYHIIPKSIVFLSRPVLVLGYALWSLLAVIRFIWNKTELKVFSHQKYIIKWLIVLLGFLLILVVSHFVLLNEAFAEKDSKLFFTLNFMQVLSGIGLTGLLLSPFFFPGILYGLPQLPKQKTFAETVDGSKNTIDGLKNNILDFEAEYLISIQQKVNACMDEFKPYLQAGFNLATLSKLINLPAHHLAYYFREEKKQAFTNYRNERRVDHAKKLMHEGKITHITLEAIGLLSGFSSRNAFFTAFKKAEGTTPGAYAAHITKK